MGLLDPEPSKNSRVASIDGAGRSMSKNQECTGASLDDKAIQ